jgi:hypothetical protein
VVILRRPPVKVVILRRPPVKVVILRRPPVKVVILRRPPVKVAFCGERSASAPALAVILRRAERKRSRR